MRVLALALILAPAFASAAPLCGVFKAVVYAPEAEKGRVVIANPQAVTSLKLTLEQGQPVPPELLGGLVEIEFRSDSPCYRDCPAELVKVGKRVAPFGPKPMFLRSERDLVKAEACRRTPFEAMGL